jgi:hypothetical protein
MPPGLPGRQGLATLRHIFDRNLELTTRAGLE